MPLSAYDRSRAVAEKVLDASNHIPTIVPEPTNISDQHKMISYESNLIVSRAEGYNGILQRYDPLPFDNINGYKTKTKTVNKQKMRQNYVAPNSFEHLTAYSHQTSLKNVNEIIRTLER